MRRSVILTGIILPLAAPTTLRFEAARRIERDDCAIISHEPIDRATAPLDWDIFSGRPQANLLSGRARHRGARKEKGNGEVR